MALDQATPIGVRDSAVDDGCGESGSLHVRPPRSFRAARAARAAPKRSARAGADTVRLTDGERTRRQQERVRFDRTGRLGAHLAGILPRHSRARNDAALSRRGDPARPVRPSTGGARPGRCTVLPGRRLSPSPPPPCRCAAGPSRRRGGGEAQWWRRIDEGPAPARGRWG